MMKRCLEFVLIGLVWVCNAEAAGVVYQNTTNAERIELTNIKNPDRNDQVVATDTASAVRSDALTRVSVPQAESLQSVSRQVDAGVEPPTATASDARAQDRDAKAYEHRGGDDEAMARSGTGSIDLNPDGRSELGSNTRGAAMLGVTSSNVTSNSSVSSEVPLASDAQLEHYKDLMIHDASESTYYVTGNPATSRKYLKIDKSTYANGG